MAFAFMLGIGLTFPSMAYAAPPAPTLHDDNPSGNFGDWYTGPVPQGSSSKPVILFVQGLHSNYGTWTGTDSYYEAAYNAGYRTAFVQLQDADGPGGNMWTNGPVLANVIRKVAAYYGVSTINIIAHSKGGIDAQTALVYYGAAPYVNVVHQLSTPNKGSELADMAYSTWTSWLADILGQKDDAVYSLQTSYMANFRTQTDGKSENSLTKTYMSGGEGDDGIFTSGWFAHAVLPGEDDGAVSVYSAMGLPYGIQSFTKNISHSAMAKASQTWSLVQPKLALATASMAATSAEASTDQTSASVKSTNVEEPGDLILRGGQVEGSTSVSFPLESGIQSAAFNVMTASESTDVTLISPSGIEYRPEAAQADSDPEGIFSKAVKHVFNVDKPEVGEWTLNLTGSGDAYFLLGKIETSVSTRVKAGKKVFQKGESAGLTVDFGTRIKGSIKHPGVTKSVPGRAFTPSQNLQETQIDGSVQLPFTAPTEPGVYNLSFDVEGVNDKGEKVTRSVNYNFAVTDEQGNIGR
nr:alpha/beta hydrolase [Paenibacillus sediminis]